MIYQSYNYNEIDNFSSHKAARNKFSVSSKPEYNQKLFLRYMHCCHSGMYLRKWYVLRTFLPKTLFYGTFFAYKVGIS